jgi:BirA family biotin operon repressor/biotin-[acetyl-CoA-carboxylase] ligase
MEFKIYKFLKLSSTQDELAKIPDLREGIVVSANVQMHGRGQQGAEWESDAGKNLLFSIYVQPENLSVRNLFDMSRTVSLAVALFLMNKGITAKIKWANDIFAGDKKIAGILIEPSIRNNSVRNAIIGIGLNVNQLTFGVERAVSMAMLLEQMQDLDACLNDLLNHFNYFYNILQKQQYMTLRNDYAQLLYRIEGLHKYRANGIVFTARILSVSDEGNLILQEENGQIHHYRFKEVEFIFS